MMYNFKFLIVSAAKINKYNAKKTSGIFTEGSYELIDSFY